MENSQVEVNINQEIVVNNGYEVREELKSNGYRYDGFNKTWNKKLSGIDSFVDEINFLRTIGVDVDELWNGVEPNIELMKASYDEVRERGKGLEGQKRLELFRSWNQAKTLNEKLGA